MPIINIFKCDLPACKTQIALGDEPVPGAERFLQVIDAMGVKKVFCCAPHLAKWSSTYRCPYESQPTEAQLRGTGGN